MDFSLATVHDTVNFASSLLKILHGGWFFCVTEPSLSFILF